jgi:deferrochelatase/peroxidase EfeB
LINVGYVADNNQKFANKESSAEQRAMMDRLQKLIERALDAYARAVALSTSPKQQESRAKILEQLTALYKNFHNNSDVGLNELIATVLSKPMP